MSMVQTAPCKLRVSVVNNLLQRQLACLRKASILRGWIGASLASSLGTVGGGPPPSAALGRRKTLVF